VRTVGKDNWALETNLGGPIFTDLGAPIPVPNLFLGARYGVMDALDISAHYNLTSPFIPGIGLDLILGEHWVPVQPGLGSQKYSPKRGWSVATGTSVHFLTDFSNGLMVVPVLDFAVGWRYDWFNPFLGTSVGFNFYRPFEKSSLLQLNPYVGSDFIINCRLSVSLRLTVYDVAYNMWGSQIDWVYLVDDVEKQKKYGAVGLSLGVAYDFLAKDPPAPANRAGGAR
jgi:hypothetical protein